MVNPYQSSAADPSTSQQRRGVRRHLLLALALSALAFSLLFPGLFLLNQELGIIPINFNLVEVEIQGIAISADAIVLVSLIAGLSLLSISLIPATIGMANIQANRRRRL